MCKGTERNQLEQEILRLKEEKDAVILAHYYVDASVQKIADYVGDSYYLSKVATEVPQQTIVFSGVSFMGESAKILNPGKTVLMPDATADCPMAHMAKVEKIKEVKQKYKEDVAVVCYINSTTELKVYADVCVTSANALKIVKALPQKYIFFIPDENLGRYIADQVPEKTFIFNDGYCPIHKMITDENIKEAKQKHPKALVLAHPECTMDVLKNADYIGSTSGIIEYAKKSEHKEFLVCTETGVFYQLEKENPNKKFYPVRENQICADMKKITLEKIAEVLKEAKNVVTLEENIREQANQSLTNMLTLAK